MVLFTYEQSAQSFEVIPPRWNTSPHLSRERQIASPSTEWNLFPEPETT